jgi:heat shock 70kDa protein 4
MYVSIRSLVAFGVKQRALGEAAKTQETSNFRNTIGSLKRLIGRTLKDKDVEEVEKKFLNATLVDVDGTVGTQVCMTIFDRRFCSSDRSV